MTGTNLGNAEVPEQRQDVTTQHPAIGLRTVRLPLDSFRNPGFHEFRHH